MATNDYYIDSKETKEEYSSVHKQWFTLYRCGCKMCTKCWFNPRSEQCVFGGPYGEDGEKERLHGEDEKLDDIPR